MIRITTTTTKTTKTTTTVYQRLADDVNNFFYNADVNYYQTITTTFDENVIKSTAATVTHNGSAVAPLDIDGDGLSLMRDNPDERANLSWQKMVLVVLFCLLIVITVIGNTLVIMSVATTRRLRTVTNCFVMSLAVADWLVGIFVMPPAVFLFIVGGS
jgi:7 transmembrane receptor (rhodopsin family)